MLSSKFFKSKLFFASLLSASMAVTIAACSDGVPVATNPASVIRTEPTPEQQVLMDAIIAEADSDPGRLFQNNPSTTTVFDVAIALAYTFPGIDTPEAALAFANDLLDRNVTLDELSPLPTPELVGGFAAPASSTVDINDVAVLLARTFPGVDTDEAIAEFVNGLLGPGSITPEEVLVPGPLPTPEPSPTSAVPALVVSPGTISVSALSSTTLTVTPAVAPEGGNLVVSISTSDATIAGVSANTLTFPAGSTAPQTVNISAGDTAGSATILLTVAGASAATNYAGVAPVTVPATVTAAAAAGLTVTPEAISAQVGSTATFSVAPTQPPLNGNLVVSVVSSAPGTATTSVASLTFEQGNTAARTVTVSGVAPGDATIAVSPTIGTTATNYASGITERTVKATITSGPVVSGTTVFALPGSPNETGAGTLANEPVSVVRALSIAQTLQTQTANFPVTIQIVGVGTQETLTNVTAIKGFNNGTLTITTSPEAGIKQSELKLTANTVIASNVNVSNIKFAGDTNQIEFQGPAANLTITNVTRLTSASSLKDIEATDTIGDIRIKDASNVNVKANATDANSFVTGVVTGSTIELSAAGNVLPINGSGAKLESSTLITAAAATGPSFRLKDGASIVSSTVKCDLAANGICLQAKDSGSASISGSTINVTAAGNGAIFVDAQRNLTFANSKINYSGAAKSEVTAISLANDRSLAATSPVIDLSTNTAPVSRAITAGVGSTLSITGGTISLPEYGTIAAADFNSGAKGAGIFVNKDSTVTLTGSLNINYKGATQVNNVGVHLSGTTATTSQSITGVNFNVGAAGGVGIFAKDAAPGLKTVYINNNKFAASDFPVVTAVK